MAQSAANWRNTPHTHADRTHSLTHLHQNSNNHVVRSASWAITELTEVYLSLPSGIPIATIFLPDRSDTSTCVSRGTFDLISSRPATCQLFRGHLGFFGHETFTLTVNCDCCKVPVTFTFDILQAFIIFSLYIHPHSPPMSHNLEAYWSVQISFGDIANTDQCNCVWGIANTDQWICVWGRSLLISAIAFAGISYWSTPLRLGA